MRIIHFLKRLFCGHRTWRLATYGEIPHPRANMPGNASITLVCVDCLASRSYWLADTFAQYQHSNRKAMEEPT